MVWHRHKKESKWLVSDGRKVRCFICGKKILKSDSPNYDEKTGHFGHEACNSEITVIDQNGRRKAVKMIAVAGAIAGAIALGVDKVMNIGSSQKGVYDPATQTFITPQGVVLPGLTSDPSNPVPGQMWYRSDAGVTAHFDGIQNRIVYSSEINDGTVVVSSKGIANGLSVLPNDGKGGFGPDTTLNATSPSQTGAPYTNTSGIQEGANTGLPTVADSGNFMLKVPIQVPAGWVFRGTGWFTSIVPLFTSNQTIFGLPSSGSVFCEFSNFQVDFDQSLYNTPIFSASNLALDLVIENVRGYASTPQNVSSFATVPYFAVITTHSSSFKNCMGYNIAGIAINGQGRNIIDGYYSFNSPDNAINIVANTSIQNGSFTIVTNIIIDDSDITPFDSRILVQFSNATSNNNLNYTISNVIFINSNPSSGGIISIETSNGYLIVGGLISNIQTYNSGPFSLLGSNTHINGVFIFGGSGDVQPCGVGGPNNILENYTIIASSSNTLEAVGVGSNATGSIIKNVKAIGKFYSIINPSSPIATKVYVENVDMSQGTIIAGLIAPSVDGYSWSVKNCPGYNPVSSPPLSANPPVSGTVYQNTNPYDIRLKIPITYNPTSTAAATLATGISSTSTVTTSTKTSKPAGLTGADGEIDTYDMVVPAGWYYELVVTNATIGTAEVQAA